MKEHVDEHLARSGLRATPQRRHVYSVIQKELDHPTAEQIFFQAKRGMPEISMATVYNCLDTLVKCKLVRQVNLDRAATRYCPNMEKHCHFYCEQCDEVYDIQYSSKGMEKALQLPEGFVVRHFEVAIQGICQKCNQGG